MVICFVAFNRASVESYNYFNQVLHHRIRNLERVVIIIDFLLKTRYLPLYRLTYE